jgi:hypothetical protein
VKLGLGYNNLQLLLLLSLHRTSKDPLFCITINMENNYVDRFISFEEDPKRHDGNTSACNGAAEDVDRLTACKDEIQDRDMQTDWAMPLSPRIDASSEKQSDNNTLCDWCSRIPENTLAFSSPSRELYTRDLDQEELTSSQCHICRLIGKAMSLYNDRGSMSYTFTWSQGHARMNPAIGTITLQSTYGKHDRRKARSLRFFVVPPGPGILQTALKKWYPEKIDFERVKDWLRNCDLAQARRPPAHLECQRESTNTLQDLRLIDCHSRRVVTAPKDCIFVALSYVWGQSAELAHEDEFALPEELPCTIEDSIAVTLLLGYRYIWIDRYVRIRSDLVIATTDRSVYPTNKRSRQALPDSANGCHLRFCRPYNHCSFRTGLIVRPSWRVSRTDGICRT